ncbi:hypothetical protein NHQ30_005483 [Ciborinia camelliae]|nr:hypothetical protein NHQ30_005483 [Ciborinia camelliae]
MPASKAPSATLPVGLPGDKEENPSDLSSRPQSNTPKFVRKFFTQVQTDGLNEFAENDLSPSRDEIEILGKQYHLTYKQIYQWFYNKRKISEKEQAKKALEQEGLNRKRSQASALEPAKSDNRGDAQNNTYDVSKEVVSSKKLKVADFSTIESYNSNRNHSFAIDKEKVDYLIEIKTPAWTPIIEEASNTEGAWISDEAKKELIQKCNHLSEKIAASQESKKKLTEQYITHLNTVEKQLKVADEVRREIDEMEINELKLMAELDESLEFTMK